MTTKPPADLPVRGLRRSEWLRPLHAFLWMLVAATTVATAVPAAAELSAPSNLTYTIPDRTIPRDQAVGTLLRFGGTQVGWKVTGTSCTITREATISGTLVPGYSNVYRTSNPGIGVRFEHTAGLNGNYTKTPISETLNPAIDTLYPYFRRPELVILGPVSSGTLSSLPSMTTTFSGSCITTKSSVMTVDANTVITASTCSLGSTNMSVTLPSVPLASLASSGAVAGNTAFSIPVSCNAGSSVYATLTDANSSGNRTDRLTLATSATAQGVAVRILFNDAPVRFGPDSAVAGTSNQFQVGSSDTLASIDLVAQYVATGTVAPGSVRAIATITMSYQ